MLVSVVAILPCAGAVAQMAQPNAAVAPSGVIQKARIQVGGRERTYVVHRPAKLAAHPALLLVFHGSGGSGESVREKTGREFDALADSKGFVVVYPDGYEHSWNNCRKADTQPARQAHIDDVAFARGLIARYRTDAGIDPKKVYAVGFSNGAQFAYRLAIEAGDEVHAVAAISAGVPAPENFDCKAPRHAVSMLIMNGTADPLNPYNGGKSGMGDENNGTVMSSSVSAEYFVRLADIRATPVDSEIQAAQRPGGLSVSRALWREQGKPSVALYTVHGGGHAIPRPTQAGSPGMGAVDTDFDSPQEIWRFFEMAAGD
ncbi:alpha/beta hydrolase family esterase [Dyella tabacisoli]|nr:PHB depolymerase family esterase [Dyella tabacisoli]